MIENLQRLREVLEEISAWSLESRRWYIAEIEKAFDEASAEQIRQGLIALWKEKKQ